MEQNNIDINELIKVESLPKIFYKLELIGKQIDDALQGVDEMICTEENKQEVKKRKQDITKFKNLMEDRRKDIKKQVLQEYELFNEKYEQEVKSKLENAELTLKTKYEKIEQEQLKEKENELIEFANQHIMVNGLDGFIGFEDIPLNITLSASIKSLKEQILDFINKIKNDLQLIELEEYKDEIMVEYKETLDFTNSKLKVVNRHKQIEEMQQRQEEISNKLEQEKETVEKVEQVIQEITPPKEIIQDDEIIEVQFTVKDTKDKILKLKEFLKEEGINYE